VSVGIIIFPTGNSFICCLKCLNHNVSQKTHQIIFTSASARRTSTNAVGAVKTSRAPGGAHVPPTKVFRQLTASVNKTIVKPRLAAAINT